MAFDCTSQRKSGSRPRGLHGAKIVKTVSKGAENSSCCPRKNERYIVEIHPVRQNLICSRQIATYPCSNACLPVSLSATSYSLDEPSSALTVKGQRTSNDSHKGKTCFKRSKSFEGWWRRIPNDAPIGPLCGHSRTLETLPATLPTASSQPLPQQCRVTIVKCARPAFCPH